MELLDNDEGRIEDNTFAGDQNSGNKQFWELRNMTFLTSFSLKDWKYVH